MSQFITIVTETSEVVGVEDTQALEVIEIGNGLSAYQIAVLHGFVGTEAEWLASLQGGGGGSETTTTLGALINGATAKATPVDADMLPLMDSAASNIVKKLSWANLKATLKTYFDTLYQPLAAVLTATTAAFTTAQETKLAGIATGATANSSDATLLARANHTGTQAQSTVVNLVTDLAAKAVDSAVVHNTGAENIAGVKTFSSDPIIPDEAFGAGWNGSLEPATKNAIYDQYQLIPFKGVFNIKAYGALVDGTTDDSAAVLAALDAAKAVGGGIIFFPAGTTRLSSESSFNPTANVQGQYVLKGEGSASRILFKTVTGIPLYFQNCGSVTIEDITFVGDSAAGSSTAVADGATALIYFAYCWKAVIQRCFFLGIASSTSTYGIVSGGESSILIRDALFAGCTTPNSGVVTVANNRNFELDNVTFIDLYEKFNNVTYSKLAGVGSMKHWVRVHTPIANTGYVRPSVIIKNCEFDENTTDVLLDIKGRVDMFYEMENCSLNSGISGSTAGMRIETFARASFRNIWAGYCPGANSSLIAKDIAQVEVDGYLHDNGATDLQLTGTTKRLRLRNAQDVTITNTANAFVDADQAMPATASATALAPKGRVTHVTGTTAVTSITATNLRPGDVITLIFDGILTFTHGNNIKLARAANVTTAAGSIIVLEYDGTNFTEVTDHLDPFVVHNTGAENIAGVKTFTSDPIIPEEAYDATAWNGSLEPPTKNAVRDEIEAVKATIGGGGYSDEQAQDAAAALFTPDDGDIDYTYNDATPSVTSTIKAAAVTLAKMAAVATGTIFYRKTAGTGDPEVQTLATLKTDLGLTGTNSGDETASTLGATINGAAAATPNNTDLVATVESSVVKKITWTNVKAFLKTYFDTLYPSGSGTSTGTNTGDQTSVSGNAGTATALQTARTIGGVSFDGTANITVSTATGGFTVSGGNLALGTNSITMSGSIGVTGTRVTKLWAVDGEFTNLPTVGGATLKSALALVKGDVGLGNVDNTSNATERAATATLENKTLIASTNVVEEVTTTASSATPTPTGGSLRNFFTVTALAAGATFAAPSGTPVNGNYLMMRIKDNGTARSLAFNAIYRAIGVTLPTTTVISKTLYIGCRYNSADSKWDVLAVGQEA